MLRLNSPFWFSPASIPITRDPNRLIKKVPHGNFEVGKASSIHEEVKNLRRVPIDPPAIR
jgi:hypothetical protein